MKLSDLKPGDTFRFYAGALNLTYLFVGRRTQGKDVHFLYASAGQTVYEYDFPSGNKKLYSNINEEVVLK